MPLEQYVLYQIVNNVNLFLLGCVFGLFLLLPSSSTYTSVLLYTKMNLSNLKDSNVYSCRSSNNLVNLRLNFVVPEGVLNILS